jgi:DNA-binding transcriptional MerR regulator
MRRCSPFSIKRSCVEAYQTRSGNGLTWQLIAVRPHQWSPFRRSGIKIPTIRYYESVGLLASPARTEGKQRRYGADEVARLNFIRNARDLGFEINDIRELLTFSSQPEHSCEKVDVIARRHLLDVDRRIAQLSTLREELHRMIMECDHGRVCECRIIETLSDSRNCQQHSR